METAFDREPPWDPRRFPPASREPRVVQTLRLGRDPMGYMRAQRAALGPVFTLRFLPYRAGLVCATAPEDLRAVLTDQERFVGGDAAHLLEPLVGSGSLILTPPPRHLPNRKRLLPPFHGERVAAWRDQVRDLVAAGAPALLTGGPVAVRPWAQQLTLDIILRLVFGLRDEAKLHAFREALDRFLTQRTQALLFVPEALRRDRGPRSPGGQLVRRREAVDALIRAELAERRHTSGGDDVLSVLLDAEDEFTDQQLRDELMGLLIAGHETTATGLAWTLHLLAHAPAARDALIEDLDAGSDTLLKATVKESMRLRPPVLDAVRVAAQDTELGGHPVPKDAFVSALFPITHLDPELWPDPHAFRPERHLDGDAAPYAWTPFGGGVRRCIGAALAQLELEVAVRELLAVAVPEAAGPYEPVRLLAVTLIPGAGGRVVMRPRTGARRGRPEPVAAAA